MLIFTGAKMKPKTLTKKQIYFAEVAARDVIRAEKRAKINAAIEQRAEKARAHKEALRQRRLIMLEIYEELGSYAAGAKVVGLSHEAFRRLVKIAKWELEALRHVDETAECGDIISKHVGAEP